MSLNVNMMNNIIERYNSLVSEFETLTTQEVLEKLNIIENNINNLLNFESSEYKLYFTALANIKEQTLISISQLKELPAKPKDLRNANTAVKYIEKKSNKNSEYTKFRNAVKNTEVKLETNGFCDIAGLDNIKNTLKTFIISPIKQPQLYKGINFSNCILFYGPPGTGKTKLANSIAAEANATLLSVTSSDILSQYVGQSEKMLQSLFQYIYENERQTVLFIDEIDGLCRQRNQDESEHSRRLKTEFMCQISNFENSQKGFLICATNCPWELDTAFVRRFQKLIYVPLPDINERYSLFKLHTKNTPLEHTADLWAPILLETEGFSGSDIVQLIQTALTIPIMQLQKTNVWKLVNDKYYEAFSSNDCFKGTYTIHFHNFEDLPPNSVRSRKACIEDLMTALNEVKRTTSDEVVKKYECYINN